jgi:hypothetical protein
MEFVLLFIGFVWVLLIGWILVFEALFYTTAFVQELVDAWVNYPDDSVVPWLRNIRKVFGGYRGHKR